MDIYEKLPVPFGLVRFGVAPDHPEVKVGAGFLPLPMRFNMMVVGAGKAFGNRDLLLGMMELGSRRNGHKDVGLGQCLQCGGIHPVTRLSPAGAAGEGVVLLWSPDGSEEKGLGTILPCALSLKWVLGRVEIRGWQRRSGSQHP